MTEDERNDWQKVRDALEPVRTIYAAAPRTGSESELFERGCSLEKNHIRAMQQALAICERNLKE